MADYNRDEMRRQEQIEDSMEKSKESPKSIKIVEKEYETYEQALNNIEKKELEKNLKKWIIQ